MNGKTERKAYIVDTTLRDGEQAAGIVFAPRERVHLAMRLAEAGIDEIEAGIPAMGEEEVKGIRSIVSLGLTSRISVWCRARENDFEMARRSGVAAIHFSVPASRLHMQTLEKNEAWVLDRIASCVEMASKDFDFISIGAQDASRAEISFVSKIALATKQAGAHRLRLADTVGVLNPFSTSELISSVVKAAPGLMVGFHGHNDLGMATANSLAAFMAGADSIDVTVNGLGERAGNAPLEELVLALKVSAGIGCGVDATRLLALSRRVGRMSGRLVHPNKPVVGGEIFSHESGIHVDGILSDARTYEPFDCRDIGRDGRKFVIGRHSGSSALLNILRNAGIDADHSVAVSLLPVIRAESQRLGRSLSDNEVIDAYLSLYKSEAKNHVEKGEL
ncbi:MAG: homocitrate synthase [Planctomycetes bacterium]|nr:homocitrate synthase [Planctomycetota bacterium]